MNKIEAKGKYRNFRVPFPYDDVFEQAMTVDVSEVNILTSLTIERLGQCEFELIDPNFEDCHADASHVIREMGLAVCANHADSVQALRIDINEKLKAKFALPLPEGGDPIVPEGEKDEKVEKEAPIPSFVADNTIAGVGGLKPITE